MNSYLYGFLAAGSVLSLYAVTMTVLSRSWIAAWEQFRALWYLMVPLAVGFGVQVGLYMKLRQAIRQKTQRAVAAGGSSAGISMLACCAHHAADILPILGLSAAATLIGQYQKPILIVSLIINIIGIGIIGKEVRRMV